MGVSRPSRNRLAPTPFDRLTGLIRPGWAHSALARRILAAALALLAIAVMLRGDPEARRVEIVVAAHDLPSGELLAADDVRTVALHAGSLPDGVLRTTDDAVGRTLAGAARSGEPLTDVRILGARLAHLSAGAADARIVPIRLADRGVAELLREGDRVDVVTASEPAGGIGDGQEPAARTLARDAAVVLVAESGGGRDAQHVVMVALPAEQATVVAAASLSSALTVVFH